MDSDQKEIYIKQNKAKMVNALEGLNQVLLRKVGGFVFWPKTSFFPEISSKF